MSVQSDVELLTVMSIEGYAKLHNISIDEATELFHEYHVMENLMLQHEYLHQVSIIEVLEYVDKIIEDAKKHLIVYHGTVYEFSNVDLSKSHNHRDFGRGFYTTILEKQSQEWARRLAMRNNRKEYYVYKYKFIDNPALKIKRFDSLSEEWLEFIKKNRLKGGIQHDYDVVIGPVADDNTMETVQLYVAGVLHTEEAVKRLRYNKVNNQISFHTEKAVKSLELVEKVVYNGNNLHI